MTHRDRFTTARALAKPHTLSLVSIRQNPNNSQLSKDLTSEIEQLTAAKALKPWVRHVPR